MKKFLQTLVLAVVVAVVATTTAHAQPYFVKTYKHPTNGLTPRDLEYHDGDEIYWVVGTGFFCELQESSHIIRLDSRGSIDYTIDYCSHDATGGSTILDGDTLLVGFNNAPIKSHFNLLLVNALSTDSLTSIQLPIDPQYSRQLIQDSKKLFDKYYIAGRGKIDSLGMIPLFYVLNADLSVDTMITVDTVFDGRISDMAMTEDSILLVMYDPKEEQVFSSPAYKVVVGYDRDYNEIVRYRSEEDNSASTTFEYLGDGEIVYYIEDATSNRNPVYIRANIYTGEILWRRKFSYRAIVGQDILGWVNDGRNIRKLADGNILIAGQIADNRDEDAIDTKSPYFAKVNIDNGDIIWERVVRKDRETTDRSEDHWIGAILDVIEHDSGDLALVGYIGSPEGNEMLFLRTDADGCLEPACGKYIDLDELAVSNEEVVADTEVRIYPNPVVDDILTIVTGNTDPYTVQVINVQGVLVSETVCVGDCELDLSSASPGIHVVRVLQFDHSVHVEKIVRL